MQSRVVEYAYQITSQYPMMLQIPTRAPVLALKGGILIVWYYHHSLIECGVAQLIFYIMATSSILSSGKAIPLTLHPFYILYCGLFVFDVTIAKRFNSLISKQARIFLRLPAFPRQ
jgi:hypothetical protein